MLIIDGVFFILASVGEVHPEIRFVGYSLIGCFGISLLKTVRKDNIANILHGSAIIAFDAKCDTCGLIASLLGSSLCVLVLNITNINITLCLFLEASICMLGHWCQAYANKRVKEIRSLPEYTFIEVINDLASIKTKKDNSDDETILDK